MELIPDWIPNIHPLLVYFPIGIILLAVLYDLLSYPWIPPEELIH